MKRGEIWTVADSGYAGKPRPAVVVQADEFDLLLSVTLCLVTSDPVEAEGLLRIDVQASAENGLREDSKVMVDKIVTVPVRRVGTRIGVIEERVLDALDQSLLVFLGLARRTPA